jgi:hypothetical protein
MPISVNFSANACQREGLVRLHCSELLCFPGEISWEGLALLSGSVLASNKRWLGVQGMQLPGLLQLRPKTQDLRLPKPW